MKWYSSVSEKRTIQEAFEECTLNINRGTNDEINLVLAFVGSDFADSYSVLPNMVADEFPSAVFIGCSGNGVIGNAKEIEHRPGFSLSAAVLPDVAIQSFHVMDGDLPDGDDSPHKWEELIGVKATEKPNFIILADPFSTRGQNLVKGLDYAFPGSTAIGGIASGGHQPGENTLFLNQKHVAEGIVGVALHGNVRIDTIVAQGCRPVGDLMRITKCDRNILEELDGQNPFEILGELYSELSEEDRKLFQNSLFLGVVMDHFEDEPAIGDFLIRNVLGADQEKGIISIGEMLQEGQTVQFHLRDSQTSSENLTKMLQSYDNNLTNEEGAGALLFSCLGRGSYLYGKPDHDTNLFVERLGDLPLTGFFCNGEIGPVGESTYIHGYTSAFGIVRPMDTVDAMT
jgi:small ligand-binding sensory domain FIST